MCKHIELIATRHAYKRAKERLSWKPKTLDRMLHKIHAEGVSRREAKGKLKKYMLQQRVKYKNKTYAKVYGEVIYFFYRHQLITMYRLDNEYIKYVELCRAA
jgi:hypothetical protein